MNKDDIKLPPLHYDELPEHTQKGDMRLKDGKLWVCSDPDINRWVCPDDRGWQLVPVEPDCDMTQAGVNLALSARISGAYPWPTYIRDMYKTMLASAPKFGDF